MKVKRVFSWVSIFFAVCKPMPAVAHLSTETRTRPGAMHEPRRFDASLRQLQGELDMNASTLKKLTISSATVAVMLSGLSAAVAAEPARMSNESNATIVLDQHSALGANDCISLGSEQRIGRNAMNAMTPVLRNRCDYAVSVSYCVADGGATVRACDVGSERETRALQAHETARVETRTHDLADKDVNWIACRSYTGVVSQFNDSGTRGQCMPDSTMQAQAQSTQLSR